MSDPLPSTVLAKVTAQSCLNLFSNTKNVIVHVVWSVEDLCWGMLQSFCAK